MAGNTVWLFQGNKVSQPSAAFSHLRPAVAWIDGHSLSGMLTEYPLNEGVYDWAIRHGYYRPKTEPDPAFIGKFSSASQKHYHFENGVSQDLQSPLKSIDPDKRSRPLVDDTAMLWVFLGEQSRHPAAVFDNVLDAQRWCSQHRLTGLMRPMPPDISVYSWVHSHEVDDGNQLHGSEVIANFWVETPQDISFLNGFARPAMRPNQQVS